MKNFYPRSLRTWISLALMLFAIVMMAVSWQLTAPLAEHHSKVRIQAFFHYELAHLQTMLSYLQQNNDPAGVKRELTLFARHPAHLIALLADHTHRVYAASHPEWIGHFLEDIQFFNPQAAVLIQQQSPLYLFTNPDHAYFLEGYATIPAVAEDAPSGVLWCRYDLRADMSAARFTVFQQTSVVVVIFSLLALFLWILFEFVFVRRVACLMQASAAFAEGRLETQCRLSGRDELAILGQAFDRMAAQIRDKQAALAASEERLKLALESTEDSLWDWDIARDKIYFSARWQSMLGYTPEELQLHPSSWQNTIHPQDKSAVLAELHAHLQGQSADYEVEYRIRANNGEWKWVLSRGKVVARDAQGKALRAVGTHTNIDERKRNEEMLRRQALILAQMSEGVIISAPDGTILDWNPAAQQLFGYHSTEIIGHGLSQLYELDPQHDLAHEIQTQLQHYGRWVKELHFIHKNGTRGICETIAVPLSDEHQAMSAVISVNRNITQRRKAEDHIRYLATHDSLTGLVNRPLFMDILNRTLVSKANCQIIHALLFVDLDGFKQVNDTLGHDQGDELLRQVALRLEQTVRKEDTVGRLGGDEFVILLRDVENAEHVKAITRTVLAVLCQPFSLHEHQQAHIGGSIGIALYPVDGYDPEELVKRADHAMYEAKHNGKQQFAFSRSES